MNKIQVIEQSVACQSFGTWSLIPVIGAGFAIAALRRYWRVRAEVGNEWNPARPQLIRGVVLAWTGIFVTLLIITFVVLRIGFTP
jgi:hypothetical protein